MATTQTSHDPTPAPPATTSTQPAPPQPATEVSQTLSLGLGQEQVMAILKHLPAVFNRSGDLKDSTAAEALADLSQSSFQQAISSQLPMQHQFQTSILSAAASHPTHAQQTGPSSHPHGPPNLGQPVQTSAIRTEMTDERQQQQQQQGGQPQDQSQGQTQTQTLDMSQDTQGSGSSMEDGDLDKSGKPTSGRRSGRSATMTNEEWTRQRKDNHKEVERRRRGNINEGINELGRIVPNGSGEKAKGAILSRAVQYIHHLKENEARNIEKWTLEKLLMDQAMGDLQTQLEEMRRMWDEERNVRQRAEAEVEVLKKLHGQTIGRVANAAAVNVAANAVAAANAAAAAATASASTTPPTTTTTATTETATAVVGGVEESEPKEGNGSYSLKRPREDGDGETGTSKEDGPGPGPGPGVEESPEERAKRPRTE